MNIDYKQANNTIKKTIEKELIDNGFTEFFIQNRVKSQESIQKKINRKDESDQKKEITDYSGVRIILNRLFEMRKCIEIITKKFEVDYLNSNFNSLSFIEDKEFGYSSSHIVVIEKGIKTEIQIRTLSQHIWASISHSLDYKSSKKDTIFPRKLFRLSSLLEQIDITIEDLYETSPSVNQSNLSSLGKLDHYSLEYYLSRKEKLFALISYGFNNQSSSKNNKQKNKINLNTKFDISMKIIDGINHSVDNNKYWMNMILIACEKLDLRTIEDLKCFLEAEIKQIKNIRKVYNTSDLAKIIFTPNSLKLFLFLILFTSKYEEELILKENLDESFATSIKQFTEIFRNNYS